MQDPTLFFHYCPKLIVFSKDRKSVLLARRSGEADYDGAYTFIGGKTETTDGDLVSGLRREKIEEIGIDAKIIVCYMMSCYQVWYTKKNGNSMVLPHHIAIHQGGEIKLNPGEYDDYKWVSIKDIDQYDHIHTTPPAVRAALRYLPFLTEEDFVEL
jgi:8-oxo-dGTP pyrophosphatase MutT (NUDIX family)